MEDYKGRTLHFDETAFNEVVRSYTPVLKAINLVAEVYEQLDSHFEFTDAIFRDIVKNRCANINRRYHDLINEQLQHSGLTSTAIIRSMRENVFAELAALEVVVEKMFMEQEASGNDWTSITVTGGKAVVTDESKTILRQRFEEVVTTDDENELYNHAINLASSYAQLHSFLQKKGKGAGQYWPIIGNHMNSLFDESGYGKLMLQKSILKFIR